MKTIAVIDACVLFQMPLCDTLLRIAEEELYRLHLSQKILDETTNNLVKKNKMTKEKADRYQQQIKQYFPESIVEDYESLIPLMTNEPKDRHVLAAAVKIKADVIITFNLKDFPLESLQLFDIKAQHPDRFLLDLFSNYGIDTGAEIVKQQTAALKDPPVKMIETIKRLNGQVPDFAKWVLFNEYSDYLLNIAHKILKSIGNKKQDKIFYKGKKYYLEKQHGVLKVEHISRGEILKQTRDGIAGNFTFNDLERFENFERELDKQFHRINKDRF